MKKYYILKRSKADPLDVIGLLSPKQRRWISPESTKHKFGEFTNEKADKFISDRSCDDLYSYEKIEVK